MRRPAVAEQAAPLYSWRSSSCAGACPAASAPTPAACSAAWPVAATEGDGVEVALLASRAPGGAADPLAAFGRPLHTSRLPSRLLTRAWDHGLTRAPGRVRRRALGVAGVTPAAALQPGTAGRDGPRRGVAPAPRGDDAARGALARGGLAAGQLGPRPPWWSRPGWWRPTSRPWASPMAGSQWCRAGPIICPSPTPPPPMRFSGRWASRVRSSSP